MVKLLRMKNLNVFLAFALLALMYNTPIFLRDITNSMIGRAVLVISLAFIVIRCDFSCAILFSLIIIVLFHNTVEGFIETLDTDDMEKNLENGNIEVDQMEADAEADAEADGDGV